MKVKIIKLVSGEEIVAEIVQEKRDLTVQNPLAISVRPKPGVEGELNFEYVFMPWAKFVKGPISLREDLVVYVADPVDGFVVDYMKVFAKPANDPKM